MDKIRIIQPYRLWRRLFSALGRRKYYILLALGITFFMIVKLLRESSDVFPHIFLGGLLLIIFLFTIFNPFHRYYKPRSWIHSFDSNKLRLYLYEYYGVVSVMVGYIMGLILWYLGLSIYNEPFSDDDWLVPPIFASMMGGIAIIFGFASGIKYEKIRAENHQDVDYNVKVDLSDLYGINDKLLLCYQNFKFDQKHLNAGNYLLGLSAKSFYFVMKQENTEKYVVNFKDLTAIGSLSMYGYSLLHFESKNQLEIDILMEQDASLAVNCAALMQKMWKTLDFFIINNENDSIGNSKSRRRISITDDKGETHSENTESSSIGNRIIDISYSEGVVSEIKAAPLIESNRVIEI